MFKKCVIPVALVLSLSWVVAAQDARSVVSNAAKAMGAESLKTIQYSGPSSEYSFGQAFLPGSAWPVWKSKSYMRTIDFEAPAIRMDRVAEPLDPSRRGGGLPPAATQTVIVTAATPPVQQIGILLSPYGFLKAAAAGNATVKSQTIGGRKFNVVTYTGANKAQVNGYIDDKGLVDRVETWIDNAVTGDTHIEAIYSDYKDFGGVKAPTRIVEKQGGFPTLELAVTDVKPNAPASIQAPQGRGGAPAAAGGQPPAATSRALGDGVYLILPAYAAIAVDFKDYIVVVEGPQSEARATAIINEAKRLIPNKPIKYVVNTHAHFDHASGLRAFAADGATIITHNANKSYLETTLNLPHTLNPDKLALSKNKVTVEGVGDKKVLTDGNHVIELYRLSPDLHQEAQLVAYFPKEKVLLEADGFLPPAQMDAQIPNPVNPNNLLENINRLKLNVETIVPVHYPADLRVVTLAELQKRATQQAALAGSR